MNEAEVVGSQPLNSNVTEAGGVTTPSPSRAPNTEIGGNEVAGSSNTTSARVAASPSSRSENDKHPWHRGVLAPARHERANQYNSFFQSVAAFTSIVVPFLGWLTFHPTTAPENPTRLATTEAATSSELQKTTVPPVNPVVGQPSFSPESSSGASVQSGTPTIRSPPLAAAPATPNISLPDIAPPKPTAANGDRSSPPTAGLLPSLALWVNSYFSSEVVNQPAVTLQFGNVHLEMDDILASMTGAGVAQCSFVARVTDSHGIEIVVKRRFEQVKTETRPTSDSELEIRACKAVVDDIIQRLR